MILKKLNIKNELQKEGIWNRHEEKFDYAHNTINLNGQLFYCCSPSGSHCTQVCVWYPILHLSTFMRLDLELFRLLGITVHL